MSEHQLMDNVRLMLSNHGFKAFRTNVGNVRMSDGRYFDTGLPKGFSDIFAVAPDGQAWFIETKIKPRKPTKEQAEFLAVMQNQGARTAVIYSIEQLEEMLNGICR